MESTRIPTPSDGIASWFMNPFGAGTMRISLNARFAGDPLRRPSQKVAIFSKESAAAIIFALFIPLSLSAQTQHGIPFSFKFAENDTESYGGAQFFPFYNAASTPYCSANHRDPDGEKYPHMHSTHRFDFTYTVLVDEENELYVVETITAQMSDWHWNAHFPDGTMLSGSGSTFLHNCYSHATGAPTAMVKDAWIQFTSPSNVCDDGDLSFEEGDDHVIAIKYTTLNPYGYGDPCIVTGTSEKVASGGVYVHNYYEFHPRNMEGAGGVRRKKEAQ